MRLAGVGLVACATGRSTRRLRRIGLQLYSLRDAARADLGQTLDAIAAIGYKDVELLGSMNNFGHPPARVREMLDRAGLRAPSTHVATSALDDLDRQLDDARILGHEALIVASFPEERRKTLDDYRHWADRLNEAAAAAKTHGVWIGFHNHADDLKPIAGTVPYDLFVERTDPALVRLQLDTANLAIAGKNPLEYVKKYGPRYASFHLKDVPELGAGSVDFPRLLASIDRIDEKLMYVEHETYRTTPLESVRWDFEFITKVEF